MTPTSSGPRTSLGAGIVSPCYARIDWATLLPRVYLDDVLACPCGGRRYVVAEINERQAIVAILNHLGLDAEPPVVARARDVVFIAGILVRLDTLGLDLGTLAAFGAVASVVRINAHSRARARGSMATLFGYAVES